MKYLFDGRPLALLYHRVAALAVDPWGLAVSPADFERHIRVLSKAFELVPLSSLTAAPRRTGLRRRLAITFDDGYADNYEVALPILERYRVPATFFISSSAVESGREFWWDTLERVFLWPSARPAAAPDERQQTFLAVWARLRDLHPRERDLVIEDLCREAGIDVRGPRANRPMNAGELRSLSRSALVEIGAHTVSHRRLATASAEDQRDEIDGSKKAVEAICEMPITSFSYPFGGRDDYSKTTVEIVDTCGLHRAYTAGGGPIGRDVDMLQVPRCFVPPGGVRNLLGSMRRWLRSPAA